MAKQKEEMKAFETGATRSSNQGKPDYRGYLSPLALKMFGEYMLRHQVQADGLRRASDNWKKGMPIERYVESLYRHSMDFHEAWDEFLEQVNNGQPVTGELMTRLEEAWGGMMFNVQGWGHEWKKGRQ